MKTTSTTSAKHPKNQQIFRGPRGANIALAKGLSIESFSLPLANAASG